MPVSRSVERSDIKFLLLIFGALLSTIICIGAIILTALHGFALYDLGVILSFASTAILSVVEMLRSRDEQQSNRRSLLARFLAFLSTLLFAVTAAAIILLSGDFAAGILVTGLTGIVACWTAAIFNDTQKTAEQEEVAGKKSQPWVLIISNLLIVGISLAAQIMTLVLFHQASLAYIFTVSAFNLALTIPILFLSCREDTFKENSWPIVIIGLVVSGLFIAGANLCEFHNGLSIFATLGAMFSTMLTFGGLLYALAQTFGTSKSGSDTHQTNEPVLHIAPHSVESARKSVANPESLSSTNAPAPVTTSGRPEEGDPHQIQSITPHS